MRICFLAELARLPVTARNVRREVNCQPPTGTPPTADAEPLVKWPPLRCPVRLPSGSFGWSSLSTKPWSPGAAVLQPPPLQHPLRPPGAGAECTAAERRPRTIPPPPPPTSPQEPRPAAGLRVPQATGLSIYTASQRLYRFHDLSYALLPLVRIGSGSALSGALQDVLAAWAAAQEGPRAEAPASPVTL